MKMIFSSLFILFTTVITGCATKSSSMYAWGTFPQQHYLMYTKPHKATPPQQIKTLEKQIEQTKTSHQAIPPGLYAHLGLMYTMTQHMDQAHHYFNLERQLYPESSVLMDRLLQKKQAQTEPEQTNQMQAKQIQAKQERTHSEKAQMKRQVQTAAGTNE